MQGFSAPGFIRACTHVLIPIFRILFLPHRCPHLNKRHAGGWAPVPATSQHLSLPFWDRSKSDDHVVIGGLWWVMKLKIVVYIVSCQNQRAAEVKQWRNKVKLMFYIHSLAGSTLFMFKHIIGSQDIIPIFISGMPPLMLIVNFSFLLKTQIKSSLGEINRSSPKKSITHY